MPIDNPLEQIKSTDASQAQRGAAETWQNAAQDAWTPKTISKDARIQVTTAIQGFSGSPFQLIDFDQNGLVSKSELQEGIDNAYLVGRDAAIGQVLLKNIDALSKMGGDYYGGIPDPHLGSIHRDDLKLLSRTLDPNNEVSGHKLGWSWRPLVVGGLGALSGCAIGAIAGAAFITPIGGCAAGATAAAVGGFAIVRRDNAKIEHKKQSLAEQVLGNTLRELDRAARVR
jgi:hypothetical protein